VRTRDQLGPDHCVGTRAIFDHDLLTQQFRQTRRNETRDDVRAAARRRRNDEADCTGGVGLRPGVRGDQSERNLQAGNQKLLHYESTIPHATTKQYFT